MSNKQPELPIAATDVRQSLSSYGIVFTNETSLPVNCGIFYKTRRIAAFSLLRKNVSLEWHNKYCMCSFCQPVEFMPSRIRLISITRTKGWSTIAILRTFYFRWKNAA